MKIASSSARLAVFVLGAAALVTLRPSGLLAQGAHTHGSAVAEAARQEGKGGALVRIVREATERFQDVEVAKSDGYVLQFGQEIVPAVRN